MATALLLGLALCLAGLGLTLFWPEVHMFKLRNMTDQHALLSACRALMADLKGTEEDYYAGGMDSDGPLRSVTSLPHEIRDLGPGIVFVRKNRVSITFGGGFFHWALLAYAEGQEEEPRWKGHEQRCTKLMEGLWLEHD